MMTLKDMPYFALMLGLLIVGTMVFSRRSAATTVPPSSAEGREVLAPVDRLFDALAKGDDELFRSQLIPDGTATIFREKQFRTMSLNDLAARIKQLTSGPDHLEEHLDHPLIRIDDNIAVIWAPYQAFRGGRLDHCGTNIFSLVRRDGQWTIAGIVDNYRTDCTGRAKNGAVTTR
jgi:hypothetical protein